jgi:voltage-gated potassium channel
MALLGLLALHRTIRSERREKGIGRVVDSVTTREGQPTPTPRFPSELRDRFNEFVVRHEIAWELTMAVLAVAYVASGFLDDTPIVNGIELALTAVFVTEFVSRFAAARDRRAYLRGHWIDLVSLVPAVRGVRILRLARLLRLVRAFAGTYRALTNVERLVRHRGILLLFTSWVAVMVVSSIAVYLAEKGGKGSTINSIDEAIWWGIGTLTAGSGDVVPHTLEGRVAAAFLMLIGVGLFAGITATVTTVLLAPSVGPPDPVEQIRRLADLRESGALTAAEFDQLKSELLPLVTRPTVSP